MNADAQEDRFARAKAGVVAFRAGAQSECKRQRLRSRLAFDQQPVAEALDQARTVLGEQRAADLADVRAPAPDEVGFAVLHEPDRLDDVDNDDRTPGNVFPGGRCVARTTGSRWHCDPSRQARREMNYINRNCRRRQYFAPQPSQVEFSCSFRPHARSLFPGADPVESSLPARPLATTDRQSWLFWPLQPKRLEILRRSRWSRGLQEASNRAVGCSWQRRSCCWQLQHGAASAVRSRRPVHERRPLPISPPRRRRGPGAGT